MKQILAACCILIAMHVQAQTNTIGSTGNVGIGTTSPNSLLHVANGDVLLQNTTASGYSSLWAKNTEGTQTLQLDYNSLRVTGGDGYIRTSGTFILNDIGGNVAIGTNNAYGYKLAVNGNAIFEGVKVKIITNWPDYVFKRDYKLLSLPELEKYIQQNNHLPDVPSAEEVAKEGLDLGSNQAALLKKIEELTLYIIQQNKKMEQMEAKMISMEKKIDNNTTNKN